MGGAGVNRDVRKLDKLVVLVGEEVQSGGDKVLTQNWLIDF